LKMARDLLERAHAPTVGMVLVADDAGVAGGSYGYGYSTGLSPMLEENAVGEDGVPAASPEKVSGADPG
jgi:hypothetical protein